MSNAAGRRAAWRWAFRLLRRDWRQQVLIAALLAFAMAIATFGVAAANNVVPTRDGEFGRANHRVRVDGRASFDELRRWFGPIEVIGHRDVPVAGRADAVDVRTQRPEGRFGGPMLRLVSGRYPTTDHELAVTDAAAALLGVAVGGDVELEGTTFDVVGSVENPADLDDRFVLAVTSSGQEPTRSTVLFDATEEQVRSIPADVRLPPIERRPACHAFLVCLSGGQSEQTTAAIGALAASTLLLLLVALIATAGFVVVAQRRLRQLGLFAAVGGTDRQTASIVIANGVLVGLVASVVGTVIGLGAWIVAAPAFESSAGHRIDRLHLPMVLCLLGIGLGTACAALASWKPARALRRTTVVAALSNRPPDAAPVRRSVVVALVLGVLGIAALSRAVDAASEEANPLLLIGGIALLVAATVRIAPALLGGVGRMAVRFPAAGRIALRGLARSGARSASALAAIALAVGLPAITVVAASADTNDADRGNLSDRQVLVRVGDRREAVPQLASARLAELERAATAMATRTGGSLVPLLVASDPMAVESQGGRAFLPIALLGREVGGGTLRDSGPLYVATPEVLARLGVPASLTDGADVLTPLEGSFDVANVPSPRGRSNLVVRRIDGPAFSSMPRSFLTPAALQARHWTATTGAWLLEADAPLTAEVRDDLRSMAETAGLSIEVRDDQRSLAALRIGATGVGLLAALGILALTLGLLRAEAQHEVRTLVAVGAPRSTRRSISAVTGGGLAGSGALLGVTMAYAGAIAGYGSERGKLAHVPVLELAVLLLGLPLLAMAASWILSGREPDGLRRAPID